MPFLALFSVLRLRNAKVRKVQGGVDNFWAPERQRSIGLNLQVCPRFAWCRCSPELFARDGTSPCRSNLVGDCLNPRVLFCSLFAQSLARLEEPGGAFRVLDPAFES